MQTISNGTDSKDLQTAEVFGFGDEILIMTNEAIKKEQTTQGVVAALLTQARAYLGERTIAGNSVPATHQVIVKEDVKLGMLPLSSAGKVLHDVMRLGRTGGGSQNESITTDTLEKCKVLGAGTFGTVWLTRHTATDSAYALKVQYKRDLIEYGQAKGVIREKKVMARMYHPFVMSIVNSQQDEMCLYMVMELMQGGELGNVMKTKTRKYLSEDDARFYAAGILEGLVSLFANSVSLLKKYSHKKTAPLLLQSYMHRRNYVYRDLKGENVLLDNDGYAVIVDLGFGMCLSQTTARFHFWSCFKRLLLLLSFSQVCS